MQVQLQPIGTDREGEVLGLFQTAATRIRDLGVDHWQYWHEPPQHKLDWMREGLALGEFFFAFSPDGGHVGMVRIMKEDALYWGKNNTPARYVHSLVVLPEHTGQGWGKVILETVEQQALKEGISLLRLDCDRNNPRLCAFYEALGFQPVGEVKLPLSTYQLYEKDLL